MIPGIRKKYNEQFTEEAYRAFLSEIEQLYPGQLDFRVAETPLFIPKDFTEKMIATCESIVDVLLDPEYLQQSEKAIPVSLRVPNEDEHSHFIAFDFGICQNENGELEPQLIEMQGFPTLFAYQVLFPEIHARHFWTPEGFSNYLNGYDKDSYLKLLRSIIVADCDPENVVLLEVLPAQQKTRIDFACTETYLGINTVDLNDIIIEGRTLFYSKGDRKIQIKRIYNRLIFDDLFQQAGSLQEKGKLFQKDLDVTWVPHPNWFYRISKYSLPFIRHPYVPETHFLNDMKTLPEDLEHYVVKPLFSFAGQGVIIDVTKEQLLQIKDPENWIIQRKVNYSSVIETPDEPAKAEIRIFYFWEKGKARPVATNNLARLSKGKMVGVRYNKDKEWVGGSFAYFEQ